MIADAVSRTRILLQKENAIWPRRLSCEARGTPTATQPPEGTLTTDNDNRLVESELFMQS